MPIVAAYHVDAFANHLFEGNPAMVCLLESWLSDSLLQAIAAENNLPVTAFLVREEKNFSARWFTPEYELEICGHGALAAGYVIFNKLQLNSHEVVLHTSSEELKLKRCNDSIELEFTAKKIENCSIPIALPQGLGRSPIKTYHYKTERLFAIFDHEEEIKHLSPHMRILKQLDYRSIVVTAPGVIADFVSRVFYPKKLVSEDAVTGASHAFLVPYWAKQLNKNQLLSRQLSQRGGELKCELNNNRVVISGKAVLYMEGKLVLPELHLL